MASTVPAVLTALTALFTTALPPTFQVAEGTLNDVETNFLIVGYDDGEQPAVTGTRSIADMGLDSDAETYDIDNMLRVWIGEQDVPTARTAMFGYLDLLDAALAGSSRLGVAGVAIVRISDFAFAQPTSGNGSMATLLFTVHVEGWK